MIDSIDSLEFFAKHDSHALQYSQVAKHLLSTARQYLQKQDLNERLVKGKASSELFGMVLSSQSISEGGASVLGKRARTEEQSEVTGFDTLDDDTTQSFQNHWEDLDFGMLGEGIDGISGDLFGSLNLFPIFEA